MAVGLVSASQHNQIVLWLSEWLRPNSKSRGTRGFRSPDKDWPSLQKQPAETWSSGEDEVTGWNCVTYTNVEHEGFAF